MPENSVDDFDDVIIEVKSEGLISVKCHNMKLSIPEWDEYIFGKNIVLNDLKENDIQIWYTWFNDPEIVKFTRHSPGQNTLELQYQFFEELKNSENKFQWAIRDKNTYILIGTISLTEQSKNDKISSIELVVGNKNFWGRGVGTEAIKLVSEFAFENGIRKLTAGMDSRNVGSFRSFQKNGFVQEGLLKEHYFIDGKYGDTILMGKINNG